MSVFICRKVKKQGKYLILKRSSKHLSSSWQMVSGGIREGELAWETALREMKEETGLLTKELYSANKIEPFYEIKQNVIVFAPVFVAFVDQQVEVHLNPKEHTDFKWVTPDEAGKYLVFRKQIDFVTYIEEEFVAKTPNPHLKIEI